MSARWLALLALAAGASDAWAQSAAPGPHIGYAYPAGGERGTVVRVFVGGQALNNVKDAHVTGDGVSGKVVRYLGRFRPLNREERQELLRRLAALRAKRSGQPAPDAASPAPAGGEAAAAGALPKHPLLDNLEQLAADELEFLVNGFLRFDKKAQPNAQIGETVLVEATIAPDAPPGDRELRLATPRGLTNPVRFQVGALPEAVETAPYDDRPGSPDPVALPVCFNGQIKPGDVDRLAFRAQAGQKLVIEVAARHLIPFLADAVPGWFQATIALSDERGTEVAFADDYRLRPDPVLLYEVPAAGVYRIEIRDALYRGREDFVYRVRVGELPFITSVFPLGGPAGRPAVARIAGWNLDTTELPLDTRPIGPAVRTTACLVDGRPSNAVATVVGHDPEIEEAEANDGPDTAQPVTLPVVVNGRVGAPGDRDFFRFAGRAGETLDVEVVSRRLGCRLDSLVRVTDAAGAVLAWNDDAMDKVGLLHRDMGEDTHHADSQLSLKLPADGTYRLELTDAQGQGGPDCAYRLTLGPARGHYDLFVTPASLTLRPGLAAALEVHVLRHGGYDGPVLLELAGAPPGFALAGGPVPAGCDRLRVTVTTPREAPEGLVRLRIVGTGRAGGRTLVRIAVPAEDVMQAFLWRHLLPAHELVGAVIPAGFRFPPLEPVSDATVEIAPGRTVPIRVRVPPLAERHPLHFVLKDPPAGLALERWTLANGELTLHLAAGAEAKPTGRVENLIVEVYVAAPEGAGDAKKKKKPEGPRLKFLAGTLPAIPCRVVVP